LIEAAIKKSFSAAHFLKEKDGAPEDLHGHNFVVELVAVCTVKTAEGRPFCETLEKWLEEATRTLHHKNLNNLPSFKDCAPSSEHIAQYIFNEAAKKIGPSHANISHVTVWEADDTGVTYKR